MIRDDDAEVSRVKLAYNLKKTEIVLARSTPTIRVQIPLKSTFLSLAIKQHNRTILRKINVKLIRCQD